MTPDAAALPKQRLDLDFSVFAWLFAINVSDENPSPNPVLVRCGAQLGKQPRITASQLEQDGHARPLPDQIRSRP